mmetsp:Transcript_90516/g.202494  ORF Transcript_90516/g.202494 Transcript_90516/m.202494 type:complete len:80 (+) Transcript_90516:395-634(+)
MLSGVDQPLGTMEIVPWPGMLMSPGHVTSTLGDVGLSAGVAAGGGPAGARPADWMSTTEKLEYFTCDGQAEALSAAQGP